MPRHTIRAVFNLLFCIAATALACIFAAATAAPLAFH